VNLIFEWELLGKRIFGRSEEDMIRTVLERQVLRIREGGCNWFRMTFRGDHSY
jgi:hypothetical protein